jgi:energy-coupling factor transport system permease protein
MRSPLAYRPSNGALQSASAAAALVYLAGFVVAAFLYSSPIVLAAAGAGAVLAGLVAGARRAVVASLRLGLVLALTIVLVNGLVTDRGETVLARLGHWPVLGQVNVTAEALAAGAVIGLRVLVAMVALGVYSACVDPDKVLRLLRPLAARSALTATLISRMVPLAAADAGRLREASLLRGPGAAPLGRAALVRRLLAGSLDRAVDVAATLELRGYGLGAGRAERRRTPSRFDRRFLLCGAVVLMVCVAAKAAGADQFRSYPTVAVGAGPWLPAVCAVLVLAGLAPLRRRRRPGSRTGGRARG